MDQHTVSSMMFCSSMKCLQMGTTPADCRIERTTCWCLPGNFETLWSRRRWLFRKNCYGGWNLGTLPPAGNLKASKEWRHTSSPKPKKFRTQPSAGKVMLTLLGRTRGNFGALHARREHCDQCNVWWSKESTASCNQVQTTWTSEYKCFAPTWQCSTPYFPSNCCNDPRPVLWVSSTSAVLARPRPRWSSCLSTAQRGKSFRSDEEVQQAVHEWLRSQTKDFFRGIHALTKRKNTCMERNGDYTEKLSHCVPSVFNKLRDKNI